MSSDLERFRDHCRIMAARPRMVSTTADGTVTTATGPTAAERDLWTQLADEIDDHLAATSGDQPMLGDA